jgi:hypothetical protein
MVSGTSVRVLVAGGLAAAVFACAVVSCGESVLVVIERDDAAGAGAETSVDGPVSDAPADVDFGDAPGSSCADASPVNAQCTLSSQCCSGYCAAGATLETTCRFATGCLGVGSSCARAGGCCSNGCFVVPPGTTPQCSGETACFPVGGTCTADYDCCSHHCSSGACVAAAAGCKPAGETCVGDPDCCGRVCVVSTAGTSKCELLQGCRPEGETCAVATDCCSERCDADATGVLRCTALAQCTPRDKKACTRQVGDVCKDPNSCCSRVCLTTGDGTKRCAAAGGCRSECEICSNAADCCSGVCGQGTDGVLRCQPAATCGRPGEICDKDMDCCNAGAPSKCLPDPAPGGPKRCHLPGAPACAGEGAACTLASECCAGRCVPGDTGALACRAACLPFGAACTSRADCCGVDVDCMNLGGALVCAPLAR